MPNSIDIIERMKYKRQEIIVFKKWVKYYQRIFVLPQDNEAFYFSQIVKFWIIASLPCFPIAFGMTGYLYKSFQDGSSQGLLSGFYYWNFIFICTLHIIIIQCRGNQVLTFLRELSNPTFGFPKNYTKFMRYIEILTDSMYYIVLISGAIMGISNYIYDAYCDDKSSISSDGYICGMITPLWFPFKMDYPIIKPLFFFCHIIVYSFYVPNACTVNVLYFGSIGLVVIRMQHLRCLLKKINFTEDVPSVKQKLKFCVQYYSEIVKLVNHLNETVGYIFAPQQNCMIEVMMGLMEYQFVENRDIICGIHLAGWLAMEGGACYAGQLLENMSSSLQSAVYDLSWYEMDLLLAKTYQCFLAQTQNKLHLQIYPIIEMNMEHFYRVIQCSFSYVAFLNNF